ncbi:metal-dependent hydrolase [Halopseudomonas pachastrellae]|nr:metal-dependent hydrolase [Halopseudomonas pachastrellae]
MAVPRWRAFFIDSVRHFRDRVTDPQQQALIKGFIGQEGPVVSTSNTTTGCRRLATTLSGLTQPVRRRIAYANKHLSPERRLAGTVAMEHFTAIMADSVLRELRWFEGSDEAMRRIWRWHALEETEHKAVAFDLYMQVCGDRKLLREAMRFSTWFFLRDVTRGVWHMLKRDGHQWDVRLWWRGMRWLWGAAASFRACGALIATFIARTFTPGSMTTRR